MNQRPTPDCGEPWIDNFGMVFDRSGKAIAETDTLEQSARTVACVNALAGVPDPAAHLAAMKEAIREAYEAVQKMSHVIGAPNSTVEENWKTIPEIDAAWESGQSTLTKLQPFLK